MGSGAARIAAVAVAVTVTMSSASLVEATATATSVGGWGTYYTSSNALVVGDDRCDRHPVYVQYQFTDSTSAARPSSPRKVPYSGGCGNSRTSTLSPGGYSRVVFRHCTDDLPPDSCSSWRNTGS